jgi:hypothetical protein
MVVDLFLVFQFIRKLVTPFEKWPAFEQGIIDDKGNVLIKRKKFTKKAQRQAFGVFDQMILNIKKLLAKVPGGSSRLGTYAAALWLIKEYKSFSNENMLNESYSDERLEEASEEFIVWYNDYIKESGATKIEDAPASNVGGGAIAGMDGTHMSKSARKKYKKKAMQSFKKFSEEDK